MTCDHRPCRSVAFAACVLWPASVCAQVPSVAPPLMPAPSANAADSPGAPPPPSLSDSLHGPAKQDYEAARLLYESGDYAGALLKFESAYRTAGDPRLLWNAAGCERNLHSYAKAMRFVRQVLAAQSPLITAELAGRAQAFLEAAQPLTAPLEIEANQPSSEVYLDDELLGTPTQASLSRVDLGTHRVVVKARGYQPYSESFTVLSSSQVHVTATLRALAIPMSKPPVDQHRDRRDHRGQASLLPTWVWVAGGGAVLAGIATATYLIFKPAAASGPVPGSIATLRF